MDRVASAIRAGVLMQSRHETVDVVVLTTALEVDCVGCIDSIVSICTVGRQMRYMPQMRRLEF
jgi:hypothetical protein